MPTYIELKQQAQALLDEAEIVRKQEITEVVQRINADVNAVLQDPAVRESFTRQGLITGGGSAADFKAFIEAENRRWSGIIKKAGISLD